MSNSYPSAKRAHVLLLAGTLCGFMLAATGLLNSTPPESADAVATVNGETISKEDYLTYLSLLAKDKRNPLSDEDRQHVLNRMIEEKLIIERGLAIGLAQSDPNIRKVITNAMIQTVTADASTQQADEEILREFYQKNQAYFSRPARIQVQRMIFRNDDKASALARAEEAYQQLKAGGNFFTLKQELASQEVLNIPNSLLPPNKLRQYIGPQLTEAALAMETGSISPPIEDSNGFTLLYVIANEQASPQPFEDVAELVANEYRRRAGDQMLRDYLEQLRGQAEIRVDQAFINSLAEIQ